MSDMDVCLNDLRDIPLNNEQNEPNQVNIGETSNEPTQATIPPQRNEFEELYDSANQELYPGCDFMTPLDFMAKFTHLKVSGKWTDTSLNNTLNFSRMHFLPGFMEQCLKRHGKQCNFGAKQRSMYSAKKEGYAYPFPVNTPLKQIYPPVFFDIMIQLVMHLPEEAIEGGLVLFRWMYPFERYMKKLKKYVGNKAKPEGSIAEGYVADKALTFCSHYFRGVETKFNNPDRNEECPRPTSQFHVF
ncbi:hypothetical protein Tco_0072494 [Tanacetum coccineum]